MALMSTIRCEPNQIVRFSTYPLLGPFPCLRVLYVYASHSAQSPGVHLLVLTLALQQPLGRMQKKLVIHKRSSLLVRVCNYVATNNQQAAAIFVPSSHLAQNLVTLRLDFNDCATFFLQYRRLNIAMTWCSRARDNHTSWIHTSATDRQHTKMSRSRSNEPTTYHRTQNDSVAMQICEGGRRGGVAARGEGSHSTLPSKRDSNIPSHRCFLLSEDEDSDWDPYPPSPPLSPKTVVIEPRSRYSQRTTALHQYGSAKRRPGWKPSLKEELLRRTSMDAAMGHSEPRASIQMGRNRSKTTRLDYTAEEGVEIQRPQRRRGSTLLHPSSPIIGPAILHADAPPTDIQPPPQYHPCFENSPKTLLRKGSSLLHPSPPLSDAESEASMRIAQLKTVLSFPPRKQW